MNLTKFLQNNEIEMLKEISKLFKANNIMWFVACGTCLGTIRHNGFIPWDDDVDIYLLGRDYDKAKVLFENHPFLRWDDCFTQKGYPFTFPKIVLKGSEYIEGGKEEVQYREGIYIDVFPLIESYKNIFIQKMSEFSRYYRYALTRFYYTNFNSKIRKFISSLIKKTTNIEKIQRKTFLLYKKEKKNGLFLIDSGTFKNQSVLDKKDFLEIIEHKFEDFLVPVPAGYENYLSHYYGDYMKLPPENERCAKHNCVLLVVNGKTIIQRCKK